TEELENVVHIACVAAEAQVLKTVFAAGGDGRAGEYDARHHRLLGIGADVRREAQRRRIESIAGPGCDLGESSPGSANVHEQARRDRVDIVQRRALRREVTGVTLGVVVGVVVLVLRALTLIY